MLNVNMINNFIYFNHLDFLLLCVAEDIVRIVFRYLFSSLHEFFFVSNRVNYILWDIFFYGQIQDQ